MVQRVASFRNRRYNTYVPACGYAADVIHGAAYEVDFLTPIAATAAGVLASQAVVSGTAITTFASDTADAPFGRNVTLTTVAGTVTGRDYLGQGMTEVIAAGGVGNKAFKWIDGFTPSASATGTIGFGSKLGLPYRMSMAVSESGNGAQAALGTFVAGVLTDPQTNATGDAKGTYTPTTALNGANRILARFLPHNLLNANGNGGLYGIQAA